MSQVWNPVAWMKTCKAPETTVREVKYMGSYPTAIVGGRRFVSKTHPIKCTNPIYVYAGQWYRGPHGSVAVWEFMLLENARLIPPIDLIGWTVIV